LTAENGTDTIDENIAFPRKGETISLSRRGLLKNGAAAVAAPWLSVPARAQATVWYTQTVAPFVEVEIASGRIRGGHSRGALAFKGIPYGGDVSGANRFKRAPKVTPWAGVRDATRLGPPSLQGPGTTYGEHEPAYSENCLVLNVWTPANDHTRRPVMFYCHGGGFETGSGGHRIHDGSHLAARYDVVVVESNHRLGLLGYLYLGELGGADHSGNQGMLDIVDALAWVKENIAAFGGDPDNVFVFGESGGGAKTSTLMAMPAALGLFHKAGIQSGAMLRATPRDTATETARRVLAGLDIAPKDFAKLHDVPAEKLMAIELAGFDGKGPLTVATKDWLAANPAPPQGIAAMRIKQPGRWEPVVDGTVLPGDPFDPAAPRLSANIPLLVGYTREEGTFFMRDDPSAFHMDDAALAAVAPKFFGTAADSILAFYRGAMPKASPAERAVAIRTATFTANDSATLADRKAAQPAAVYRYINDYRSNFPITGTNWTLRAGHATDIALTFDNSEIPDLQGNGPGVAEAAHAMSGYFAGFARSGVPSAQGQPAWPRYDAATREVMLLNAECRAAKDPNAEEHRFWQSLGW
jgi:para-nitrobenzyl esterase